MSDLVQGRRTCEDRYIQQLCVCLGGVVCVCVFGVGGEGVPFIH